MLKKLNRILTKIFINLKTDTFLKRILLNLKNGYFAKNKISVSIIILINPINREFFQKYLSIFPDRLVHRKHNVHRKPQSILFLHQELNLVQERK